MKRYYQIIDRNEEKTIRLNIDIDGWSEVLQYLKSSPEINKEFVEISQILLRNLLNTEKYKPIKTHEKFEEYFEMIFTSQGRNDGILCRDYQGTEYRDIILIEVFKGEKGTSNINRMIKRIAEKGGFDYDIEK